MIAQAHFICCLIGYFGLLLGFELIPGPHKGISGDAYNWSVVAFFAFGALTVLLFSVRLRSVARAENFTDPLSLRFGMMLLAVLSGLYLCGTTIDHWLFFSDPARSGVAEPAAVGGRVKCGTDVLVRLADKRVIFRCPSLLVFGRNYSQPFVPWPSYTQGEMAGDVLLRAIANAPTTRGKTSHEPVLNAQASAGPSIGPHP
ncbi:hypothetical protein [Paraburkholderia fungorum]|uniref:hypothetical protein n=1 Tax=Paraburkholderia fungorum TaxID=134537 RepID=UPI00241FBCB1|nr:hypothetical protein [Paraburkholderia fungorum]